MAQVFRGWASGRLNCYAIVFGLQRFLIDTEQLVAKALEQDRCNHLEAQADTIAEARDFGLPRSEWSKTK
eukprot:982597-Pyramimonas_sp.AAC.1